MCSYFIYPYFSLIVVADQSSRYQRIPGSNGCSLWCQVHCSSHPRRHSMFKVPGGHSVLPEAALQYRVTWGRLHLGPVPAEIVDSDLLCWRLLVLACSGGGCCLKPVSVNVPGLGLLLQRSLTWAQSCTVLWLGPAPLEVPELFMDQQRSLVVLFPQWSLPSTCSCGGYYLRPGLVGKNIMKQEIASKISFLFLSYKKVSC